MAGVGIGELIWLVIAVLIGLGVVIAWIVKAEAGRNLLRTEIKRLKSHLESSEREKVMMIEEVDKVRTSSDQAAQSYGPDGAGAGNAMIARMIEKTEALERENARLIKELNESRSSLEEVYKALCEK